jgi:hypothetical protein
MKSYTRTQIFLSTSWCHGRYRMQVMCLENNYKLQFSGVSCFSTAMSSEADDLRTFRAQLEAQRNAGSAPSSSPMTGESRSRSEFEGDEGGFTSNTRFDSNAGGNTAEQDASPHAMGFGSTDMSSFLFTVENGRALKRHKNLSAESEADAEYFLQVCARI